jgi:phage terminase large subunit-like protein
MPESRFRIFHLGQWVEGVESWLGDNGRATWRGLVDPYEFVPRTRTWVGIDVGLKQDSTAVVWAQRRPDGRLHVKCKIWLPAKDKVINVAEIMEFLRDLHRLYDVDSFAYDPRLFQLPAMYLTNEGLPMLEMNQSLERMCPAFAELLRAIKSDEITHDDDPAFEAQVLNGRPKDMERGFTLYKRKYTAKIDANYAMAMMFDRAQHPVKAYVPLIIAR